jgi:5-methylcytosine-specific restriction endonuclease McrA
VPYKTKEARRADYEKNKEKQLAQSTEWKRNNREKARASYTKWVNKNPDKVKANRRNYYENNLEAQKKYSSDFRKENPEIVKEATAEWKRKNPDKVSALQQKRRAQKNKAGGYFTSEEWYTLCFACGFKCLCCKEQKPLVPDHVVPIKLGGTSWLHNIQPLCQSCNSKKGIKTTDYRDLLGE